MERTPYLEIAEKIDRNYMGAPRSEGEISKAFLAYLALLFSPREAEAVRHVPMMPNRASAAEVAAAAGLDAAEAAALLNGLVKGSRLLGLGGTYAIPPMPLLLNVHQFRETLEPADLEAARLYQDFFIKEGYYKRYEGSDKGTPLMRAIPVERAVDEGQKILDAEEAHRVIEAAGPLALVPCPCRTRTEKMGERECKERNPVGACIMTGMSAMHFIAVGLGKKVSADQAKSYLDEMQDLGLVAMTDNFADRRHTVICLCCECCCSQTRGRTRWDYPYAPSPANFLPEADEECVRCGTCVERCFFGALSLDDGEERPAVEAEKCIGCGVCAVGCKAGALRLRRIERSAIPATPGDLIRRVAAENR